MEIPKGSLTKWIRHSLRESGSAGLTLCQLTIRIEPLLPPENAILRYRMLHKSDRVRRIRKGIGVDNPLLVRVTLDQQRWIGTKNMVKNALQHMVDIERVETTPIVFRLKVIESVERSA